MWRLLVLALLVSSSSAGPADLGDHDSLPMVPVPFAPPRTDIVSLDQVWRLDCGEDAAVVVGGIDAAAAAPGGGVLLLDRQLGHALLVDARGRFVRTYGRAGQGPGETAAANDVCALPGGRVGIVEGAPSGTFLLGGTGRINVLDAAGDPLLSFRPAAQAVSGEFPTLRDARAVGDRLLVGYNLTRVSPPEITTINRLILCDGAGDLLATLGEKTVVSSFTETKSREADSFEPFGTGRYDLAADGRMALLPSRDAYVVVVRAADGGGLRLVGQPTARVRTPREIAAAEAANSAGPFAWVACETEPALVGVRFHPDGELWVELCPQAARPEPGDFGTFDVFDRWGQLLRRVRLVAPGDPATDRLLALADGRFVLVRNHHVPADSAADDVGLAVLMLR
jgi:hypothetical protein